MKVRKLMGKVWVRQAVQIRDMESGVIIDLEPIGAGDYNHRLGIDSPYADYKVASVFCSEDMLIIEIKS